MALIEGWRAELRALAAIGALAGALAAVAAIAGFALGAGRVGLHLRSHHPASLSAAGSILLANASVLALLLAAAALRAWVRLGGGDGAGWVGPATRVLCDGTVALVIAANALRIGVALGALGGAAIERVAPQVPLELGGFALGALCFLRERRTGLRGCEAVILGLGGVGALAAGALVETYVPGPG
jgi:hypothetical protein